MSTTLNVNGRTLTVDVSPDTPLLWTLRDVLGMTGTKFGCGMALCGACTVHLDGQPIRSCVTPVAAVAGKKITTIEAIGLSVAGRHVPDAWRELDVVQCGYCQSGQIMSATALVVKNPAPSDAEIDAAMAGNICRCGTYVRIRAAIKLAAQKTHGHAHSVAAATIVEAWAMGFEKLIERALPAGMSRRAFLKAGAAAGGGLLIG